MLPVIRPNSNMRAREREKKRKWLKQFRKTIQHLSLAPRPQTIRMMIVKDNLENEE